MSKPTEMGVLVRLIAAGIAPTDADAIVEQTKNVQDMYVVQQRLLAEWQTGGLEQAKREAVIAWWNNEKVPFISKRLLTASEV